MNTENTVTAELRDSRGKNEARRLRVRGLAPAVLYGASQGPVPVAVSPKDIIRVLRSKAGHNSIFNLEVQGGETTPVMIADWQHDPIKETLLHVDLKRIDMTKRVHVRVPVVTFGDPRGVKEQGGLLELVTREVEIDCLPVDIPEEFRVDVSGLLIGQNLRASSIPLAGSVKLLTSADAVIAHVVALKAEAAPETTAEGAATTAAPAEPEVIKKGKKEEEGAAEEKGGAKKK
ncbi:MAG TPA: 50S ribosomal protein L25 [Bryobacteraceae bacterium]|nr:50S ribosomal protein L25 [Bryobacteraceae bacterium]